MFSKNVKLVVIIMIVFVMSLSSVVLFADCDMMAMIAKKGNYISWMNYSSSNFDDPSDFFLWQKNRSFDDVNTVKHDDDGYVSIYNIKGQKVNSLVNDKYSKGIHSVTWNGKDDNNRSVSSGVYFYKISAGKSSAMKKMLLLK